MFDRSRFNANSVQNTSKSKERQQETPASVPPASLRILTALCGIVGIAALGYYYSVPFPLPPPNATAEQVMEFATRYHDAILLDAWIQGVGSLLIVTFFVALVSLSSAAHRFAGLMTLLASTVTLTVTLMDVVFAIATVQSLASGHPTTGMISFDFTNVFVHVFPMLPAPVLFLAIGAVLISSRLLPRLFGFLAMALGAAFAVVGFIGLFNTTALGVTIALLIGQELWIVAAAIALILIRGRSVPVSGVEPAVDQPAIAT